MKICYPFSLALSVLLFICSAAAPDPTTSPIEIPRSGRFLAAEPHVEIKPDGIANITVTTLKPCTGGRAYLGVIPHVAELEYPFYRLRGGLTRFDSLTISAEFNLKNVENRNIDIDNLRENRGGHLAYRLALFSDKLQVFDRVFAYGRSLDGEYYRAAALIEGPFVDCVTPTSAVISWEFDRAVDCRLQVQPGDLTFEFDTAETRREFLLSGLAPGTTYDYQITWVNGDVKFKSPELQFRTAPPLKSQQKFSFAVFSDTRATYGDGDRDVEGVNAEVIRSILTQAYIRNADLILVPGDLVSGTTSDPSELENQFRSWKRIAGPVGGRIPIYEGIGNHDLTFRFFQKKGLKNRAPRSGGETGEAVFARHFVNPVNSPQPTSDDFPPYSETVYSFDWGNSHFTMLNSDYHQKGPGELVVDMHGELRGTLRDEQLEWLDRDLDSARKRGLRHLFVFNHHPAFPNGGHVHDAMWWDGEKPQIVQMRDRFWRILCRHKVLALFAGHEHNYSRALIDRNVDPSFDVPVWQIITGGGGAPYYARDESIPWKDSVQFFYPLSHFCLVEVDGENVILEVLTPDGLLVERVDLNP